ncbi:MAG TPA: SusC/RagA family TonB-linked outer membrane protein, partial [Flavisolibacter sp.]|nr:SusC/RagA family TonB-linked outer membrane protein [Flavisolibacter sp.]
MNRLLFSSAKSWLFIFFLFLTAGVSAQTVTGKVADENGQPLAGVSITEKGTPNGTASKADGSYVITVKSPKAVLVFSFVGHGLKEFAADDASLKNIVLPTEDRKSLESVVVVGYGTQRRKDLTGAIGSVGTREIEKLPANSVDKALQGQVAGLQISTTSGAPGGNTTILVRGISSITGGIEPLFVIDGYPVTSVGYSNPLSTINPSDIESIDVLKDASATAIYGSRGSNGVIIITTKRGKTGKPKVEFNSYLGVQEITQKIKMMNAQQFAQFVIDGRNAGYLDNPTPGNPNPSINDDNTKRGASYQISDKYKNKGFLDSVGEGTDWQDAIFRQALVQSHQVSVTGGNEGIRYSLSSGYFNQDGIVINTNFKRYSFKLNLDAKVSEKLTAGVTILPSYSSEVSPPIVGHY